MAPSTGASDDGEGAGAFPAPYGQYLLLHRLARGGMGNVFLAKTGGMMGIEKHCVVKTLRGRYTHDPEYVQRFMEEARVVVQLSHRNICPVFDVGRVGDSYYLAMELVIGRDVRHLTTALEERGRSLPEALALHITCEMLDALDYAHRHADTTTGQPLHIVHRDVSPQNVMISVEGEVKLIDFGLAESGREISNDHQASGATTVMGKMAYMAPEQARGEIVDARADQFSAAVVAYELIVGQRYYAGLTTQQIWQQAGAGQFRPAGIATLEPELRAIFERALAPAREDRYPSTGDFREALLGYARSRDLHAGARELRAMVGELFAGDLQETRELLQRFAHVSLKPRPGFLGVEDTAEDMQLPAQVFSIATSVHSKEIHDPTEMFRTAPARVAPEARPWAPPTVAAAAGVVGLVGVLTAVAALALFPSGSTAPPGSSNDAPTVDPASNAPAPAAREILVAADAGAPSTAPRPLATEPALADAEPGPASNDAADSTPTRRRHKPRRTERTEKPAKQEAPLTTLQRVEYLRKTCRRLACATPLFTIVDERRLGDEDPRAFKAKVEQCFAQCAK